MGLLETLQSSMCDFYTEWICIFYTWFMFPCIYCPVSHFVWFTYESHVIYDTIHLFLHDWFSQYSFINYKLLIFVNLDSIISVWFQCDCFFFRLLCFYCVFLFLFVIFTKWLVFFFTCDSFYINHAFIYFQLTHLVFSGIFHLIHFHSHLTRIHSHLTPWFSCELQTIHLLENNSFFFHV